MHRSSSKKRCFVLEGKSKVLGVQAAAFRKGTSWDYGGTGNLMLLSVLSLVVVDWRKGLPGRLAAQCQGRREEGGRQRSLVQGPMGMKMRSFTASTLFHGCLQSNDGRKSIGDLCL